MIEYKITSDNMPAIKGQADMVLAATIKANDEGANISNMINGKADLGAMAAALGKLVANVADQADGGEGFILMVAFEATAHLMGADEAQEGEE